MNFLSPQLGNPLTDCTRAGWTPTGVLAPTPGSSKWDTPDAHLLMSTTTLFAPASASSQTESTAPKTSRSTLYIGAAVALFALIGIAYAVGFSQTSNLLTRYTWERYEDGVQLELDFSDSGDISYVGSVGWYSLPIADMEYRVVAPEFIQVKRTTASNWEFVHVWQEGGDLKCSPGITSTDNPEIWH